MNKRHIKVVYHDQFHDNKPHVYEDDKRLNETEIVELLIESFKDYDELITENEHLKKELFISKALCLWYSSDSVDRALYFEDEVKELADEMGIKLNKELASEIGVDLE